MTGVVSQVSEDGQQQTQVPFGVAPHSSSSNIILLTDPSSTLYNFELVLRNQADDGEGNLRKCGDPLMNDYGINMVMGATRGMVNQITFLGKLDQPEIVNIMYYFGDTVIKDLMINKKKYEIKTDQARTTICYLAQITNYITMKRPFEGGERTFWKGTVQELHTKVEGGQKKSLFGSVFGWGNK